MTHFDSLLKTLTASGVEFIVVGGAARDLDALLELEALLEERSGRLVE